MTHSFGEPHDEEWDNDWLPMPYYDLPGDSLMRSDSFGELIGGLSGLINLQNYHHQGPAALLSNLNPASQGSPSLKGALTMEMLWRIIVPMKVLIMIHQTILL